MILYRKNVFSNIAGCQNLAPLEPTSNFIFNCGNRIYVYDRPRNEECLSEKRPSPRSDLRITISFWTYRGHDLRDGGVQGGRRGTVTPPGPPAVREGYWRIAVVESGRTGIGDDVVRREKVRFFRVGGGTRAGGRAGSDGRVGGYLGYLETSLECVVSRGVRRFCRYHVPRVAVHRGPGLERRFPDDVENPGVTHHDGQARHHERANEQDLLWRPTHRVR